MSGRRAIIASILAVATCVAAAGHAEAQDRRRPLLGAIRWDMYTGHPRVTQQQEFGFLKPPEFQWRAPFFVRKTGIPEKPLYFNPDYSPDIVQEATDQEILYASSCGINYWAFGFYGDQNMPIAKDFTGNLEAYLKSPYKQEINFCIIMDGFIVGARTLSDWGRNAVFLPQNAADDWDRYVKSFIRLAKEPTYQRVLNGRPLLYVYSYDKLAAHLGDKGDSHAHLQQAMASLREHARVAGIGDPYIAFSMNPPAPEAKTFIEKRIMDAVFSYHYRARGTREGRLYARLWSDIREGFLARCDGLKVIPPLMSGANWMPRVRVMPQTFPPTYYTEPRPGELGQHVAAGLDYVAEHPGQCEANTALMYAWNEHSEGGFLCPTMGDPPDYRPDTREIDEVSRALKNWTHPKSRGTDGGVLANFGFGDRTPTLQSVADEPRAEVSAMRLPPFAYYVPVTNAIRGKRGFSVAYHVRNSADDYFEFTVKPPGKATTMDLRRIDVAVCRDPKSPPLDLVVQASSGGGAYQDLGPIRYGQPGTGAWEESGLQFPASYSHLSGKVTIRLRMREPRTGERILVDDIRLRGSVKP
jgi:hypothetical protein